MRTYGREPLVRSTGAASVEPAGHTFTSTSHLSSDILCFKEEAYPPLSKSPCFGMWDPDVLRNYADYALVEDTSGRVRLKYTITYVRWCATCGPLLKLGIGGGSIRRFCPHVSKRGRFYRGLTTDRKGVDCSVL